MRVTVVESALYALLLATAAVAVWRRPAVALYLFVVGLAVHNAVMAALYAAGVRGTTLTAITAWKEILLAVALARVATTAVRDRRLPFRPGLPDWLALAFALLTLAYALVPQSALGGEAGRRAVALALRHDLVPVAAFFLGRALRLGRVDLRRLGWTLLGTAGAVAALGLADVYTVPIGWWRTNGVVDYFHRHLGYDYHGTGCAASRTARSPACRRTSSTTSAATGRSCAGSSRPSSARSPAATSSSSRSSAPPASCAGRAAACCCSARSRRLGCSGRSPARRCSRSPSGSSCSRRCGGGRSSSGRRSRSSRSRSPGRTSSRKIAPTGNWTKADLVYQHQVAAQQPAASGSAASLNESSLREHWSSLRDGVRTIVHHPQGYGLGNVGQTASRTGTPLLAGESNYTELGVELGAFGGLLWIAWVLSLLAALVRAGRDDPWAAALAAAFAAILALAVQTDVIGDPWVAYCVWGLAGSLALVGPRPVGARLEERLAPGPRTT